MKDASIFNSQRTTELAMEQIALAQKALAASGYFTEAEIGGDIAARITELVGHYRRRIEELEEQPPETRTIRLRVLELPQCKVDDFTKVPYILVIDRCPVELLNHEEIGRRAGAECVLVFAEEVELG